MDEQFVDIDDIVVNNLLEKEQLCPIGHECVCQVDTDSNYCCFEEYRAYFPDIDDVQFFYHLENQMNKFWNRILEIKAKKNNMPQLIIFNRENMFTHFFSFAKKMYMGDVVDSEGDQHWKSPKSKIQGIALKRTNIPSFCKEAAVELCFSIMRGITQQEAEKFIIKSYKEFVNQDIESISSNAGVHEYNNYTQPMDVYLEKGLFYANKTPFSVKCALNWNYVTTKEDMSVEPIAEDGKYRYVYVLPNNKYGIDVIGYVGKWPERFNELFKIDYETNFRKSFLSCPEKMFLGLNWIRPGELIPIKENKLKKFFK